MSNDGYLPDDVTEDMVPGNRPEDRECELPCPCAPDAPEVYSKCGGDGECLCSAIFLTCPDVKCTPIDPVCTCPSPAEIKAERDERRAEVKNDYDK